MLSDEWLLRYRLLENFNKVNGNGNGNAYDRGDYNSSFALRAVELKIFRELLLVAKKEKIFVLLKENATAYNLFFFKLLKELYKQLVLIQI